MTFALDYRKIEFMIEIISVYVGDEWNEKEYMLTFGMSIILWNKKKTI